MEEKKNTGFYGNTAGKADESPEDCPSCIYQNKEAQKKKVTETCVNCCYTDKAKDKEEK